MPVINFTNINQLSQEHSPNPCHKCTAVNQIFFSTIELFSKLSVASHTKNSHSNSLVTLYYSQEVGQCYKQYISFADEEMKKKNVGTVG